MPDGTTPENIRLLTVPGERFAVEREQMRLFALTSDMVLHVSRSHAMHPFVVSFTERLRKLKVEFTVVQCSIDEVAALYAGEPSTRAFDVAAIEEERLTQMQAVALDHIQAAVLRRASDVHIHVSAANTLIRYRIDGLMYDIHEDTSEWGMTLAYAIYHGMTDVAGSTFTPTVPMSAQIRHRVRLPNEVTSVRVETLPSEPHFTMYLRLMYEQYVAASLVELGYLPEQVAVIDRLGLLPQGLILVSGPTGSGKTTTVHVMLADLDTRTMGQLQMISMEDPIELPLPRGHVQVSLRGVDETDRKAGFQVFARSSMRADPDVFFMGEIRDTVSAELAVQAATTGHPVFGTVHANDAFAVPNRLQNLGMDLRQVLDDGLLRGMIAQRLVPRLCPHCRLSTTEALAASEGDKERQIAIRHFATLFAKPHQVTAEDGTRSTSTQHDLHFRNLKGCSQCDRKGVKGRMVVAEVVELDATLLHLFREARGFVAKELWQQRGNLTLRDVAARRVREGQLCPIETANIVEGFDDQKEIIDFKAIEKAERAAASRGRA